MASLIRGEGGEVGGGEGGWDEFPFRQMRWGVVERAPPERSSDSPNEPTSPLSKHANIPLKSQTILKPSSHQATSVEITLNDINLASSLSLSDPTRFYLSDFTTQVLFRPNP